MHYDACIAPINRRRPAVSNAPRVDYQTDPSRYKHWKIAFEGPVATLGADFDVLR